jgi:dUTP pyrophosphatase
MLKSCYIERSLLKTKSRYQNTNLRLYTVLIENIPLRFGKCKNKDMLSVRIINTSNNPLPQYETTGSAGMDLRAFLEEPVWLNPLERQLIPTGLYIELPHGYEAQIRPRSGLAWKKGLSIPNAPGTIDTDYRGEIKVILINLSNEKVCIEPGERIAQMVIASFEQVNLNQVDSINDTERGAGGFGSTGVK